MDFRERLLKIKNGELPKETGPKPKKPLRRTPIKHKVKEPDPVREAEKADLDAFFERNRPKMTGRCQCGCSEKSQKHDNRYYRHCIAHIFPKSIFRSIMYHDQNWVERTFWGGHHANMDNKSIELWPNMGDWENIKRKFYILESLLTKKEKAHKFYSNLKRLVENG